MKMTDEEILYNRELKIIYRAQADAHHLIIGGHLIILERGILDELSRTPLEGLKGKLNAVNPDIDDILRRGDLSYEKLWWAIIEARFMELESELNDAYRS